MIHKKNLRFQVIVIRKLNFKKKMQQWSKFGQVVELRTSMGTVRRELRSTLLELRHILLSYAAPYWATPHPTEIRRTLLSLTNLR